MAGILLDMVGGKNIRSSESRTACSSPRSWSADVWAVARQVNAQSFVNDVGREVLDDHLPLNDAGIPTIDLIDFDYPLLAQDRTTCPRIARPRAWPKSAACSPPGWHSPPCTPIEMG